MTGPLIGIGGWGFASRIDPLSVSLFFVIALVGLLVTEFSRNYLSGNPRQRQFMSSLALTIATAIVVTTAGNLGQLLIGWVAMSLTLHQLLIFFSDRPRARAAAHKKFVVARLGDLALTVAFVKLWLVYGTADIAELLLAARSGIGSELFDTGVPLAAPLIALAALLKSAQFPTHGWLTEVMETPTPVSALLHAGIVNAGGFLIIRFADIMVLSPSSMQLLIIVGGITAVFGSLVMATQTTIKEALGYSTVAQMGFMLVQAGFGAFSAAGLHLVAHAFYKAHSFLASGNAVSGVRNAMVDHHNPRPRMRTVLSGFALMMAVYAGVCWLFAASAAGNVAVQALGAIFMMGLFVFAVRSSSMPGLLPRVAVIALFAGVLYFTLQLAAAAFFAPLLPEFAPSSALDRGIAATLVVAFALVTLFQLMPPANSAQWYRRVYVHFKNGLYANAVFSRLTGAMQRD